MLETRSDSAERATINALHTIQGRDGEINAFLQVFEDRAMEQARAIDAQAEAGEVTSPVAGMPIAIKDNICLDYGRTTCASRMLEHYESPFTATAAQRLIDAGAVIVGKTNLDEFAMGSSGEHSAFGPTRNPRDLTRVPGGSSSGSAAAVAAGMVPAALGSDTGGSIRQPAGFCGVVGFKPTYGRVSRSGLVAFASSLDQIGVLADSVEHAAQVGAVICGYDPADATSSDAPVGWEAQLGEPSRALSGAASWRVAIPREARSEANDPAVTEALERAERTLRAHGATIVDVELPHSSHAIAAYYIVSSAEASSNLARFDGVRYGRRASLETSETLLDLYERSRAEGLGPEVQRRIMLGTHVLSSGYYDAYYATALKARRVIKGDYDRVFDAAAAACDAILMPSSPTPAFRLGEMVSDPMTMYLQDIYTVSVNLAGLPAITIRGGLGGPSDALPIGLQLIGRPFDEGRLLGMASGLECGLEQSAS